MIIHLRGGCQRVIRAGFMPPEPLVTKFGTTMNWIWQLGHGGNEIITYLCTTALTLPTERSSAATAIIACFRKKREAECREVGSLYSQKKAIFASGAMHSPEVPKKGLSQGVYMLECLMRQFIAWWKGWGKEARYMDCGTATKDRKSVIFLLRQANLECGCLNREYSDTHFLSFFCFFGNEDATFLLGTRSPNQLPHSHRIIHWFARR